MVSEYSSRTSRARACAGGTLPRPTSPSQRVAHVQGLAWRCGRAASSSIHDRRQAKGRGVWMHSPDSGRAGQTISRCVELQGRKVRILLSRSECMPKLMCMMRLSDLDLTKPVTVERCARSHPCATSSPTSPGELRGEALDSALPPRPTDARMAPAHGQADVDRVQESFGSASSASLPGRLPRFARSSAA